MFSVQTLKKLRFDQAWRKLQQTSPLIVGIFEENDPRDFLRTATCCNSYKLVRKLWQEKWYEDEYDSRIKQLVKP